VTSGANDVLTGSPYDFNSLAEPSPRPTAGDNISLFCALTAWTSDRATIDPETDVFAIDTIAAEKSRIATPVYA